jgi:predicted branched-subunit amino acid permease
MRARLTLSGVKEVLGIALGSLVALGLGVVLTERFPALHRGWQARRGRRPVLYVGALLSWTVVGTFGLMAVVSLLALVFPGRGVGGTSE